MDVQKNQNQLPSSKTADKLIKNKLKGAKDRRGLWVGLGITGIVLVSAAAGAILAALRSYQPLTNCQVDQNQTCKDDKDPFNGMGIKFTELTRPVNVLILGIDNDDNFDHPKFSTKSTSVQAFSNPSDTMLLMRFLPEPYKINVLSIPRDTLVQLPGIPTAKIDWANLVGGAPLAIKTVSKQLEGIPVDRYVRLSRNGFIELVDALGGIEVNIPKRMDYVDETQHLNIHFLPGRQKLNGRHMQEYVRFRHDKLGDIGRVQRQQEVLKAIMQNLLQPATIAKLPQILQVAKANIDTDLSLEEILTLIHTTLKSDHSQNNFLMLPGRFSRPGEYSRSYWIEDTKAAAPILARYFNANVVLDTMDNSPSSPSQLKVAVANATGQPEVASRVLALLKNKGYTRAYLTDHEIEAGAESVLKTQIIAQHGNQEDAQAIQKALGLGQVQVMSTGDIWSDITIVIGSDFSTKVSE